MTPEEIDNHVKRFFENPINRLIFARLGEIDRDRDRDGPMDLDWVLNGDRSTEKQ